MMIRDPMAKKANLDALIKREDFEILSEDSADETAFILPGFVYGRDSFRLIRKPLFQRATSDWTPRQIVDLVKNFLDRDLVPSIIIWSSPNRGHFVMDGAHRLSALIAWVNDDYGNGTISRMIYGEDNISDVQKEADKLTRDMMHAEVRSYAYLTQVSESDDLGDTLERKRARGMSGLIIPLQRYTDRDPRKAETAFYRINQGGTVLNGEEREIIRTRRWPESIAARMIWRAGSKGKYTPEFSAEMMSEIGAAAQEIHNLLLKPDPNLKSIPVSLPIVGCGHANDSIGILDQFVHLANKLPERVRPKEAITLSDSDPKNDLNGKATLALLMGAKRTGQMIASKASHSLGLHPGVYVYSKSGKFLPGALCAQIRFIQWLEEKNKLDWFTELRGSFEIYICENKHHLTQLTHDSGAGMKSAPAIMKYWQSVLASLEIGEDPFDGLSSIEAYKSLTREDGRVKTVKTTKPSKGASAALHLRESLKIMKCEVCHAPIWGDAWQKGHVRSAKLGGIGHSDNLNPEHPYCNSGYKTRQEHLATKADPPQ